jgi:hypothetical protein
MLCALVPGGCLGLPKHTKKGYRRNLLENTAMVSNLFLTLTLLVCILAVLWCR